MTHTLFLFGTLRHLPLLEQVSGREARDLDLAEARLAGHRAARVEGQAFPMLEEAAGRTAPGLLLRGADADAMGRLDLYEGAFGYGLRPVTVETAAGPAEAVAYFADDPAIRPGPDWSLEAWVADWGAIARHAAGEIMSFYGTWPDAKVAALYPMALARAAQRARAEATPPRDPARVPAPDAVQVSEMRRPYADFFAVNEYVLRYRRFDGSLSREVERAIFVTADASLVLPYDPVRDRVMLIEQFRPALHARGDADPWCLEPIAGRIDPGETPEAAAHREAREEAGLALKSLELVSRSYASPGNSTEFYHIFLGIADLPDEAEGLAGAEEENEDIRSHVMSFDAALRMADADLLPATPAVLAVNWLARNRDRLRGAA